MARSQKWWTTEAPLQVQLGNALIEYFQDAGVLQFFNIIPGAAHGRSKGVVFHLDKMTTEDLDKLHDTILVITNQEKKRKSNVGTL